MPRIAITPTTAIADYEEAIRRAGGDVWRLSFTEDRVEEVVQHADGVLLTGGGDVDPALYGASPHPTFDPAEPGRDAYEDRKSTRLNSSHSQQSRMPSSA